MSPVIHGGHKSPEELPSPWIGLLALKGCATIHSMLDPKWKLELNRFAGMPLPPQFKQNFRYPAPKGPIAMDPRMATYTKRNQPTLLVIASPVMYD
jgi:hypothetical protein